MAREEDGLVRRVRVGGIGMVLAMVAAVLVPGRAAARTTGIELSCHGCHGSGPGESEITVTTSPAEFGPGDDIELEVVIRAMGAVAAGVYVRVEDGIGSVREIADEGLRVNGPSLTHLAPKAIVDGAASFRFGWQAPDAAGAVRFVVHGLAINGDRTRGGDWPGEGRFDFVFGCAPRTYYYDYDGDGHGRDDLTYVRCADDARDGWATEANDCDDLNASIHPGATEQCNQRDDDCDGVVDRAEGEPNAECVPADGGAAPPCVEACSDAGACGDGGCEVIDGGPSDAPPAAGDAGCTVSQGAAHGILPMLLVVVALLRQRRVLLPRS